jgi:pilus assembly protein Flp/PilA
MPPGNSNERGATAVEYGLLIAGIATVIVLVIVAFGGEVGDLFDDTCASVASQTAIDCD